MADLSISISPAMITSTSDAASDAQSKATLAQSKASDASSAAIVSMSKASDASSATTAITNLVDSLGLDNLADPNVDRIMFWDDGAGSLAWLACGNSMAITDTTLDVIQDIRTTAGPTFDHIHLANDVFSSPTHLARVGLSGDQALDKNTWTKVDFDYAWADPGGNFDIVTNDRYVAPVAGYYAVNAFVCFYPVTTGKQYYVAIYKNGASVSQQTRIAVAGESIGMYFGLSDVLFLKAAEYLELYVYTTDEDGVSEIYGSYGDTCYTWFTISKIV